MSRTLAALAVAVAIASLTSGTRASGDALAGCPVTLPGKQAFTPPAPYPASPHGSGRFWFGDERLWTALPSSGRWLQLAYGEKVFWWTEQYDWKTEPVPALTVSARRLDVAMDRVVFDDPTNSFHESFQSAMLVGVTLPTLGCWEITARYRNTELTFVVAVMADDQ